MKFLESYKVFKNEDPRGPQIFNNDLTVQEVVDKDKGILTQDDGSKYPSGKFKIGLGG